MKKTVIVVAVLAVIVVSIVLLRKGSPKPQEPPQKAAKVKVGYLPSLAAAQLYVAQIEGFFSREGLEVSTVEIFSGPETIQALQTKSVDVVFGVLPSAILARANGVKVRCLVGATTDSKAVDEHRIIVGKASEVQTVAALKGKKIGLVAEPTSDGVALFDFMAAQGLTRNDYQIVKMPHPEMVVALASGSIDAAAAIEPFISEGRLAGKTRELAFYYPDKPTEVGTFLVHDEWLVANADTAKRFARAIRSATSWINSDQSKLRSLLSSVHEHGFRIRVSPEAAREIRLPGFREMPTTDGIKDLADLLTKHGFLKSAVNPVELLAPLE